MYMQHNYSANKPCRTRRSVRSSSSHPLYHVTQSIHIHLHIEGKKNSARIIPALVKQNHVFVNVVETTSVLLEELGQVQRVGAHVEVVLKAVLYVHFNLYL